MPIVLTMSLIAAVVMARAPALKYRDPRAIEAFLQRGRSILQNVSHFQLAERRPALAYAVMAPFI